MSRIRFSALILACALICLALGGCHGQRPLPEFRIPDEFDTSREFEVTFWAKNDTNIAQVTIYQNAIAAFEELYPNITVNMRLYTDYSNIYRDVINNQKTRTTPNVCITYPDHIATYLRGINTVVPLDALFTDEKYGLAGSEIRYDAPSLDELVPKFLNECVVSGSHYAIPFMRSTEACYINKTYVEALGYTIPDKLTWDFVWEVSEAAMAKDGDGNFIINGQKTMIPFIYKSTDNMMIQMLAQLDAPYSNTDGDILLFNDTTKSVLMEIKEHAATGAFSTFAISSYPANFLNAGQCIFAIDSTAGATWMGSDAPLSDIAEENKVRFETVVMPIPQFDTDDPKMISQGPSICVFNKEDPQEVLAAWLFAQFLLTNDVQNAYSETEGYVPVTLKAQESEEYKEYLSLSGTDTSEHYFVKIEASRLLIENTENTFITAVFNGSASLRSAAGQLIENVVKSVRRKQTVDDESIKKLYTDVTKQYHLDEGVNGPMPGTSVTLLSAIGGVWVILIAVFLARLVRQKRSAK